MGSAENEENDMIEKGTISIKNSSPGSKADFSEKLPFGIWRLILSAGHIIFNIQHII